MIIAVDGNEANVENKVGVSVYTYELLHYFQKNASKDIQFVVFLREPPNKTLPSTGPYFSYTVVPGPFAWSQIFLPLYLLYHWLKGIRYSVFFSPAHYAPRFILCKSVVTIHDLSYMLYPSEFLKKDLYQLIHWTRYSVHNATCIIAVSHTTKNDIAKYYGINENKIHVVHNGFTITNKKQNASREWKPYILYVGTIQPRKNIKTLVNAFSLFQEKHPEFSLKIVGKKGWMYEDTINHIQSSKAHSNIELLGFVDDQQKNDLYRYAFCTVLPSFYEGFGLPMLEAMNEGCPVIAANTASLPEIGGDSALYFDPLSPQTLLSQLERLHDNPEMRLSVIQNGISHVSQFSWDTCGEQTLAILRKTVS